MTGWKVLIVNACVTALIVALGIAAAASWMRPDYGPVEDELRRQAEALNAGLQRIERAVQDREPVAAAIPAAGKDVSADLADISLKLDTILATLSAMEGNAQARPRTGLKGPAMQGLPPMPPMPGREGAAPGRGRGSRWIDTLPEEKKEAVQEIFRESAREMREQIAAERQGGALDLERFRELREEREAVLQESLREVLSDEEFDAYLEERARFTPGMPGGPGLPPLPGAGGSR